MNEATASTPAQQWLIEQLQGAELLRHFQPAAGADGVPTDADIDAVYRRAYNAYSHGQYERAAELFMLCNHLRPLNPVYVQGLALSYKRLRLYGDAVLTFARAYVLDPDGLNAILELAHCLLLLEQSAQAIRVLEAVLDEARKRNERSILVGAMGLLKIAKDTQHESRAARS